MKRILFLAGICFSLKGMAQVDTTKKAADTIKVGDIMIIKQKGENDDEDKDVKVERKVYKPSNISTNWGIVDIGISQFRDRTDYTQAIAQGYLAAGANENWFDLRNGKSINVNIWFFMQRLNLVKHVVNLKYGLGLELNNYRYSENIKYNKTFPLVSMSAIDFKKNKLAADYLTLPLMLNFNFTPNRKNGFGFSVGGSAGYLYASRQKMVSDEEGKKKDKENFDLRKWKISYIAELSLGPIKLYGSYATQSMYKNALDHTPYNVGFRISN